MFRTIIYQSILSIREYLLIWNKCKCRWMCTLHIFCIHFPYFYVNQNYSITKIKKNWTKKSIVMFVVYKDVNHFHVNGKTNRRAESGCFCFHFRIGVKITKCCKCVTVLYIGGKKAKHENKTYAKHAHNEYIYVQRWLRVWIMFATRWISFTWYYLVERHVNIVYILIE